MQTERAAESRAELNQNSPQAKPHVTERRPSQHCTIGKKGMIPGRSDSNHSCRRVGREGLESAEGCIGPKNSAVR